MRRQGKLKVVKGLLRLNFVAFPFLWVIIMLLIGLESTTYSGFIGRNFFVDLRMLLVFLFLSGLFARSSLLAKTGVRKVYEYYRLIGIINKICFPAFFTLMFILLSIESKHFHGYIYTRFLHLDPYILSIALFFSFFLFLLRFDFYITPSLSLKEIEDKPRENTLRETAKMTKGIIVTGGISGIILWIIIMNIFNFCRFGLPVLARVIKNPFASYEWKMREMLGPFYSYTQFVNANTPGNALILHPKMQSLWPEVSNEGYTRYFVYPRDLVAEEGDEEKKAKITHIFIIGRKELYKEIPLKQWPDQKIPAERLIYMTGVPGAPPTILEKDYDPNDEINDYWGIIELRR